MKGNPMEDHNTVLCAANSYIQTFYLNPMFDSLPKEVKQQLQILCVNYTEDVGGIFTMEFDDDGKLLLKSMSNETDYLYDDIGADTKIREMSDEYGELFQKMEMYYLAVRTLGTNGAAGGR